MELDREEGFETQRMERQIYAKQGYEDIITLRVRNSSSVLFLTQKALGLFVFQREDKLTAMIKRSITTGKRNKDIKAQGVQGVSLDNE